MPISTSAIYTALHCPLREKTSIRQGKMQKQKSLRKTKSITDELSLGQNSVRLTDHQHTH